MTKITRRKLKLKTGTEGPSYDPYGWSEYIVLLNDDTIKLRISGLGDSRLYVNGRVTVESFEDMEAAQKFEQLTGLDVYHFQQYYYRINRCYDDDPMGPLSRYE